MYKWILVLLDGFDNVYYVFEYVIVLVKVFDF